MFPPCSMPVSSPSTRRIPAAPPRSRKRLVSPGAGRGAGRCLNSASLRIDHIPLCADHSNSKIPHCPLLQCREDPSVQGNLRRNGQGRGHRCCDAPVPVPACFHQAPDTSQSSTTSPSATGVTAPRRSSSSSSMICLHRGAIPAHTAVSPRYSTDTP